MVRTRHRISALALALVFVFAGTAEGMGIHRCPHHDVLPGTAQGAATHDHGAAHHAHGDDPGTPAHENCTCMGACQPGGVATLPDGGSAAVTFDSAPHRNADWWSAPSARAALVPFLLPFANGPPTD